MLRITRLPGDGGIPTVVVEGRLTEGTMNELATALDGTARVRIDVSGVRFADAAGVGAIRGATRSGAELAISFGLMTIVLLVSNTPRLARFTGLFAGLLVATYISLEAPLSGMSMNPARSFGSAFSARSWTALWVYFTAPPLGMLLAAETYLRVARSRGVFCAKLHHDNPSRCIFCAYREGRRA